MTENGYEGEQYPPPWDIAGPSSLAAILDTVFTSTHPDSQHRNNGSVKMECDEIFDETDDEIEVIPSVSDAMSPMQEEQSPDPVISSNYVNSTSPNQSYDMNMMPLSQPIPSHTPVPEEYQPLPDSSSSLDYAVGGIESDSNSSDGPQRYPDVNLRYQPKPPMNSHRGYYYPQYAHYPGGMRPNRDYLMPSYQNNVIVVNDERPYLPHPMPYLPPGQRPLQDEIMAQGGYNHLPPIANRPVYSPISDNEYEHANNDYDSDSPERPSRRLNISPRHRLSKENEANTNSVVVISEEEDNSMAPRQITQCSHAAQIDIPTSTASYHNNMAPPPLHIKREPHDHAEVATQAAGDADNRGTQQLAVLCGQQQSNHQNRIHALPPPQQNANNSVPTAMKNEPGDTSPDNVVYRRNFPNPCFKIVNGSQTVAYVHNQNVPVPRPLVDGSVAGGSTSSMSHIKEEPVVEPPNIKQEVSSPQASGFVKSKQTNAVKIESTEQPLVKPEPGVVNTSRNVETTENVSVKTESNDDRQKSHEMDAGGDRRVKSRSPQPGPSSERPAQSQVRANSTDRGVSAGGSAARGGVLSAPDLQLDWVSDSSDDDVQVLEGGNSRVVIDLTRVPDEEAGGSEDEAEEARALSPPRYEPPPPFEPPLFHNPPLPNPLLHGPMHHNSLHNAALPQHAHFVRARSMRMGGCMMACRGCCCAAYAHHPHHAHHAHAHAHIPMPERRRDAAAGGMAIAPPYLVHERLWQRQQHMLEVQRRSMMPELPFAGNAQYQNAYAVAPASTMLAFPEEYEQRDMALPMPMAPPPMMM